MTRCPRVVVAGVVAASAGILLGLAASIGLSYAHEELSRPPVSSRQAIATALSQGLGVAFAFVDAQGAAAFETSLLQAEQRVRGRLAPQDVSSRWRLYRSREPSSDGRVLYMLWFEEHGDLETEALSELLPGRATAEDLLQRSSEDSILTLVPVSPAAR